MIILKEDGSIECAKYENDEALRAIVCPKSRMLEPVRLFSGLTMWGDEEAKLVKHGVNHHASLLYRVVYRGDYMAGNVAILADDGEGGIVDSDARAELALLAVLAHIDRAYNAGLLGAPFDASGPHCEIRELTAADLRRMFGVGAEGGAQ